MLFIQLNQHPLKMKEIFLQPQILSQKKEVDWRDIWRIVHLRKTILKEKVMFRLAHILYEINKFINYI